MNRQNTVKYLRPIWSDIGFMTSGKRCTIIEVRFKSEEIARQHTSETLKIEVVLLPIYMGKTILKIRIANIPLEVDAACLVAAQLWI